MSGSPDVQRPTFEAVQGRADRLYLLDAAGFGLTCSTMNPLPVEKYTRPPRPGVRSEPKVIGSKKSDRGVAQPAGRRLETGFVDEPRGAEPRRGQAALERARARTGGLGHIREGQVADLQQVADGLADRIHEVGVRQRLGRGPDGPRGGGQGQCEDASGEHETVGGRPEARGAYGQRCELLGVARGRPLEVELGGPPARTRSPAHEVDHPPEVAFGAWCLALRQPL